MGRPLHAASLRSWQRAEDRWGKHPECPVELLADDSQVWRVPPGTECGTVFGTNVTLLPFDQIPADYPVRVPRWIWVQQKDGEYRLLHWTELRRLDYTPAPAREEVPAATRAHG